MQLSSDIWVYALIRRVELAGSFATVVRKGDARGGAVLVKTFDRKTGNEFAVDRKPAWTRGHP